MEGNFGRGADGKEGNSDERGKGEEIVYGGRKRGRKGKGKRRRANGEKKEKEGQKRDEGGKGKVKILLVSSTVSCHFV